MPVAAQVIRHASTHPDRVAVSGPYGDITYGALARRALGEAASLTAALPRPIAAPAAARDTPPALSPPPADGRAITAAARTRAPVVGICLRDPVEQLIAILAADLTGATPLLYEPTLRDGIPADLLIETLLTTGPTDPNTQPSPVGADPTHPNTQPSPVGAGPMGPGAQTHLAGVGSAGSVTRSLPFRGGFAPSPGDLAWACFSSGSTGRPRAVVRTRESWTGSFGPVSEITGIGADDVVLVPGPLTSSLYGFAAVHALAVGATVLAPGRWAPGSLPELARRATAVHVVPHLLPRLLDALPEDAPLRVVVVGGAALPPEVRERAGDVRVVAYYGATELSFVAVDADGGGLRPFPGVEIEVRPPLGEVWARSPWLAEGYLGGVAGPLKAEDKWMSVGDLADPYTPGEPLRLRGRGDGAIQTGGATVVPEDVEEVLRRAPGVGDVVVVGSPHPELGAVVTAVVEAGAGPLPSRTTLEKVARDGLAAAQRPRRWYAITDLPRTPTGKPARAQVAARLTTTDPDLRRLP
ncbi:ANL family adenylate-forming protein [Nonomuraea ferruginea]|uniref:Fatty acid--CoA ligase family protein n=1 Tax=Nonomuraea ferruginea TaxID=46174 RepID=A0ABT4SR76_9ACTN|nr:fatty acid--CoA ligase family protein [Nonomuraea ferruginea]MDA0639771.1 fatty acid--CoA ligase family protein [Nonomuraea ferruginea]